MSRLGEPLLVDLAHAGGGEYYRAGRNSIELERIFEDINRLEKRQLESQEFTLYKDRYQWLLAAALLLMAFEVLVVESVRPRRRWRQARCRGDIMTAHSPQADKLRFVDSFSQAGRGGSLLILAVLRRRLARHVSLSAGESRAGLQAGGLRESAPALSGGPDPQPGFGHVGL